MTVSAIFISPRKTRRRQGDCINLVQFPPFLFPVENSDTSRGLDKLGTVSAIFISPGNLGHLKGTVWTWYSFSHFYFSRKTRHQGDCMDFVQFLPFLFPQENSDTSRGLYKLGTVSAIFSSPGRLGHVKGTVWTLYSFRHFFFLQENSDMSRGLYGIGTVSAIFISPGKLGHVKGTYKLGTVSAIFISPGKLGDAKGTVWTWYSFCHFYFPRKTRRRQGYCMDLVQFLPFLFIQENSDTSRGLYKLGTVSAIFISPGTLGHVKGTVWTLYSFRHFYFPRKSRTRQGDCTNLVQLLPFLFPQEISDTSRGLYKLGTVSAIFISPGNLGHVKGTV